MNFETNTTINAMVKIFVVPAFASAAATAFGFMFMWPKSRKEGFFRFFAAILFSIVFGPALNVIVRAWWPGLFDSAKEIAILYGAGPEYGFLFISAPLMVMAGLPAWWIIGAYVRWFGKRSDKDIGELATDAASIVKNVRGAL